MAHTTSPGQRAARIRDLPLADLTRLVLAVDCTRNCGTRTIPIRDIAGVYGADQTLMRALLRMRCRACRGGVSDAWIVPGVGVRGAWIPVLGRGTM